MQKKLISLAVAGMFAAPAAFAATSNVDIYGKLHMSVSFFNDQGPNCSENVNNETADCNNVQFSSNASRIGFKGSEDLGGGLSAIWQIENGVNLDEQNGSWDNRNSFIGLSSKSWGTALIGNHDTPLKLVGRKVDLFGDTIADSRNVMAGSMWALISGGASSDARTKNTLAYISPDFTGFSFAVAYVNDFGTSGTNPDTDGNTAWNLSAAYENGPLYVGLAYGDGDAHENLGLGSTWRVAASYAFGDFKVVGQYDKVNSEVEPFWDGYDAWMLGGQYKMGNYTLKANYMSGNDETAFGDIDVKQWTLGVDYALSKRTSVYALYLDGENIAAGRGAGSSDQVWGSGADGDVSAISLGMVHTF